jgi:hypothetical protein
MRGSPILRAVLAFLAILALAPLLSKVTASAPAVVAPVPVAVVASKVQLALAFTALPKRVAIKHLGREVWANETPSANEETALEIPWPEQGGELLFRVEWPDGAPLAAMRVKLTTPQDVEIERSLWGAGPVETVLNFP